MIPLATGPAAIVLDMATQGENAIQMPESCITADAGMIRRLAGLQVRIRTDSREALISLHMSEVARSKPSILSAFRIIVIAAARKQRRLW